MTPKDSDKYGCERNGILNNFPTDNWIISSLMTPVFCIV